MSGSVVGVKPASDRQSRTTAKPRATPKPTRPSSRRVRRVRRSSLPIGLGSRRHRAHDDGSVRVSANDPSRTPSGQTKPASRALLPVGLRRANSHTPMTTPVTVSQRTSSRRQNIPAAAGHRRRARRSPGRSPGTTDFASRPGFPHDLGWGPLRTYHTYTRRESAERRSQQSSRARRGTRPRSVPALADIHARVTSPSGARKHVPRRASGQTPATAAPRSAGSRAGVCTGRARRVTVARPSALVSAHHSLL